MNLRELLARIRRLEEQTRTVGPPSPAEAAELALLEREHSRRFPGEIDTWEMPMLEDFILGWSTSESARHLAELRHRALPASEQAEIRATAIAIESMDATALDEWFAEMTRAAREEHP